MVAALLSLRWRIVRHQYRRDWWRVLSLVAGLIWSLSAVPTVLWAATQLSYESTQVRHDALVALAVLLGFGWVAVPLLVSGVDDALDPTRFASWGVPARRLMPGLLLAALTTAPAVVCAGLGLVMASVWRGDGGRAVLAVGAFGALVTVATWVVAARLASLWAVRLLAQPWGRAVAAGVGIGVIATLVAAAAVVRANGLTSALDYEFVTATSQAGGTPLASGIAAAAHLADGDTRGAAWRLALVCGWLLVLVLAWRAAVAHALVHPIVRSSASARQGDAVLSAATAATARGRVTQAVRARTLRSWRSDPRYVAQVVGTLATPAILVGLAVAVVGTGQWLLVMPALIAVMIGWARHNDVAFESSAIWIDIVAGARGADITRGRLAGALAWSAPVVLAASLGVCAATGRWEVVIPVAAAACGALAVSIGVAAAMSVLLPYRVPAPGENPFQAQVGSLGASLASQALSSFATGIAIPLVIGPLVAAVAWGGAWWWVTVGVAAVLGPATLVGGVWLADQVWRARIGRMIGAVA